jgi:XTP/dITP diphosphohydrolase
MSGNASIIVATRNAGKFREISELLRHLPVRLLNLGDFPDIPDVVEDGSTLRENALIKGREVYRATGIPAISDDTGLEVDALGGRPGVLSARFAGEGATYAGNNAKLLALLSATPPAARTARFVCVAACVDADTEHVVSGVCEGRIASEPRGTGGFGYDPLFIPVGETATFAEIPPSKKNDISHRALAFRAMADYLAGRINRR